MIGKSSIRKTLRIGGIALLAVAGSGLSSASAAVPENIDFNEHVLPLMESMCYDCHNSADQKGSLDLEVLTRETDYRSRPSLLENIDWVVSEHEMPPSTAENQPTEDQRQIMLDWARDALMELQNARPNDPGVVVSPRINSAEYDYVLRDLTGEDLDIGQFLTGDSPGGEGFLNAGSSLTLSVGQFESFLSAAKMVMNYARIGVETGPIFFGGPMGTFEDKTQLIEAMTEKYEDVLNNAYSGWYERTAKKVRGIHPKSEERSFYVAFLEAAWQYRYRAELGMANATPADIANNYPVPLPVSGVERAIEVMNQEKTEYSEKFLENEILKQVAERWQKLPAPTGNDPKAVRDELIEMVDWVYWISDNGGFGPHYNDIEIRPEEKADVQAYRGRLYRGIYGVNVDLGKVTTGEVYLAVSETYDGGDDDFIRWEGLKFEMADGSEKPWQEVIPGFVTSTGQKIGFGNKIGEAEVGPDGIIVSGGHWVKFEVPQNAKRLFGEAVVDPEIGQNTTSQVTIVQKEPESMVIFPDEHVIGKKNIKASEKVNSTMQEAKSFANAQHKPFGTWNGSIAYDWDPEIVEALKPFGVKEPQRYGRYGTLWGVDVTELIPHMTPEQEKRRQKYMAFFRDFAKHHDVTLEEAAPHAKKVIGEFATKAWRRDVTVEELQEVYQLFVEEMEKGALYENAMRQPLIAILMAPRFLYRFTESRGSVEPYALDDRELATRLAFTLWASLPDKELLDLADAGKLNDPAVLRRQALRMIQDPRFRGFIEQFASHWLHFADYEAKAAPDMEKYEEFKPELKQAMIEEVNQFLKYVFKENHSMLTLLDADFTFLNETLAGHYGINGVKGEEFQKVALPEDSPRGGLVGMGAFQVITSTPLRTSPVHRGLWVYETVLGKPVPEPPPVVPQLSDEEVSEEGLTVAQQLAQHREDPACFSCHDRFDPLGVAMENFDPIGRWRTETQGKPVDSLGIYGDGEKVEGVEGLKTALKQEKESFLQNFARKLIGYGTSRSYLLSDKPLQEEMIERMVADDYKPLPAILALIESKQFRMRRDSPAEDQQASLQ